MPELPDITIYLEAIRARISGEILQAIRVNCPFLVRTFEPPLESAISRRVVDIRRLGKRIAIGLEGDLWLVFHLMIAGRFQWKRAGAKVTGKIGLAAFDFSTGCLMLTEASTQRRASIHVLQDVTQLALHQPSGLEILSSSYQEFSQALLRENHTLKRALTDPKIFSGIGNAYSDEILHRARLSPLLLTTHLRPEEIKFLYESAITTLTLWIERLRTQSEGKFPTSVTAFREEMAVHGKFGMPCPDCGSPVQRIRYADNETNYCARCQTGGRVLADRSLSRLLKEDWPRSIDDWE